jgi:hypothetical protein
MLVNDFFWLDKLYFRKPTSFIKRSFGLVSKLDSIWLNSYSVIDAVVDAFSLVYTWRDAPLNMFKLSWPNARCLDTIDFRGHWPNFGLSDCWSHWIEYLRYYIFWLNVVDIPVLEVPA